MVEFYKNDLSGLNTIIEPKYDVWQAKRKNIEDILRSTIALKFF